MSYNDFHEKLQDFLEKIPMRMFIFEVQIPGGQESFVLMYKNETLADLYNKISIHFNSDIKHLFYYTPQGEQIIISTNPRILLLDYIYQYSTLENKLVPLYDLPEHPEIPIAYKIYLEN
jgi:hypothetical protein